MGDPNGVTKFMQRLKAKYGVRGKAFYVSNSTVLPLGGVAGADNSSVGESELQPFATIDYAIGKCTASRGDAIFVDAFHAETVTAAITMDVAGVRIIGLTQGNRLPVVTGNGTIDALTITAANCSVENIEFAAPETDAQTADINVAAAKCAIINTRHIGSQTSKNKVDIITIAAGSHDLVIDGVKIYNSVVECVGGIVLEGISNRVEIKNCVVLDTIGFTDGCISDEAVATAIYVHHNLFQNNKAATAVVNFVTNSTGVCAFNHVSGRHTTLASNVVTGTGIDFFENRVTEQASLNGAIIPAADTD